MTVDPGTADPGGSEPATAEPATAETDLTPGGDPGRVIAVTAASGALGGRVATRLAALGVAPRLLVRDAARAPRVGTAQPGGAQVGGAQVGGAQVGGAQVVAARVGAAQVAVVGGYEDGPGMRAALAGVDTVLLISASEAADRVSLHTAAVDAARDAGVSRIVYISFLGAAPQATFTFARDHWHTEEHIRASGLAYTILRDNLYLDVLPYFPGHDGVVRGPAGTGRFGGVARDDIADAAVGVLTAADPAAHDGKTYDITGPESISMEEVAAALTAATGRLITYDAETLDQAYASRAVFGAPDWEVAGWVTSYQAIAVGELDVVTTAVSDLAGHPPMSFADYLDRYPQEVARLRG